RRVGRDVADREHAQQHVVVRLLERRETRQDYVGVARRLVQEDVEAEHELEPVERGVEARAVRRTQHRVAGNRDQRSHLTLAGRFDLFRQTGTGQLAIDLRRLAYAAVPPPETHSLAAPRGAARVRRPGGRTGEHRAAGLVEMAGEDVDDVDEPARQRAELLRASADTRIHRGAVGRGQLARQAANHVG